MPQLQKFETCPNFSAFRLQRDILHSSSAGIIFLNKVPWEGEGNQTLGTDLRFNPKEGVSIFGSLAKTWTDGLHDKDLAGKISGYWETGSSETGSNFYIVYNELWRAGKIEQRSIVVCLVLGFVPCARQRFY